MGMTGDKPPFLVRIEAKHLDSGDQCVGSGILIHPQLVLTCAHVAVGGPKRWQEMLEEGEVDVNKWSAGMSLSVSIDGQPPIPVETGDGSSPRLATDQVDMALLRLSKTLDASRCAPFTEGISYEVVRELASRRVTIHGFHGGNSSHYYVLSSGEHISPEFSGDRGLLYSFALPAHVIEGYSGGPAVVESQGRVFCIGMAALGRQGLRTVVCYGADALLDFVRSQTGPRPLDAELAAPIILAASRITSGPDDATVARLGLSPELGGFLRALSDRPEFGAAFSTVACETLAAAMECWHDFDGDFRKFEEFLGQQLRDRISRMQVDATCEPVTPPQLKAVAGMFLTLWETAGRTVSAEFADSIEFSVRIPQSVDESAREVELIWEQLSLGPSGASANRTMHVRFIRGETPFDHLLEALVNRFMPTQPRILARELVDQLATGLKGDLYKQIRAIWEKMAELEVQPKPLPRLIILSRADHAPAQASPGAVLTGESPQLKDLKSGCFVKLPVIRELVDEVEAWFNSLNGDEPSLPVFWIGGRSGDGKSVALLYVLSELRQHGYPVVGLLESKSDDPLDELPDAVRYVLRTAGHRARPILGINDPCLALGDESTGGAKWDRVLEACHGVSNQASRVRPPALIVSGPAEQQQFVLRLQREINITSFTIPSVSEEDMRCLYRHHTLRSGQELDSEEEDRQVESALRDNKLAVQMYFEWSRGERLDEFAQRFRQRLKRAGKGLVEWMDTMLLLNCYGVGFPTTLFDRMRDVQNTKPILDYLKLPLGEQRISWAEDAYEVLDELCQEEHVALRTTYGLRGYGLNHAAMVRIVYRQWREMDGRRTRFCNECEHLLNAARAGIQHGGDRPGERTEILWALFRRLGSDTEQGPLEWKVIEKALSDLMDAMCLDDPNLKIPDGLGLWFMPVLIRLQQYRRKSQAPSAGSPPGANGDWLKFDPAAEAVRRVSNPQVTEDGIRLASHILLRYGDDSTEELRNRILDAVQKRLSFHPDWQEWPYVADDLLRFRQNAELCSMVGNWSCHHPQHPLAPRLLAGVIPKGGELSEEWKTRLSKAFGNAREDVGWGDLGKILLDHSGTDAVDSVLSWVERYIESPVTCFLIGQLLIHKVPQARALADRWLEIWYEDSCANYVLEPYLRLAPTNPALLEYARRWIATRYGNSSLLMEHLIRCGPRDENDRALAVDWLRHFRDRTYWSWVWNTFVEHFEESEDLLRVGKECLFGQDYGNPAWPRIWRSLYVRLPRSKDLLGEAHQWLKVNEEHPSWPYLWRELHQANFRPEGQPDDAVREEGFAWLRRFMGTEKNWKVVWYTLLERTLTPQGVFALGCHWLAQHDANDAQWPHVWRATWDNNYGEHSLQRSALEWLTKLPDDAPGYVMILRRLRRRFPWNEKIRDAGMRRLALWLGKAEALVGPQWYYIWSDYLDMQPGDASLEGIANTWFNRVGLEHDSWPYVWRKLWSGHRKESETLVGLAREWLPRNYAHRMWPLLWRLVESISGEDESVQPDEELLEFAMTWLDRAEEAKTLTDSDNWAFLWLRCWSRFGKTAADQEPRLSTLRDLAIRNVGLEGSFGKVWQELEADALRRAQFPALAERALREVHPRVKGWDVIYRRLAPERPERTMRDLCHHWLDRLDPSDDDWPRVWQRFCKLRQADRLLWASGTQWLRTHIAKHSGWLTVWYTLANDLNSRDDALAIGRHWLNAASPQEAEWPVVWQRLWELCLLDGELSHRSYNWLTDQMEHPRWCFVWRIVWDWHLDDAFLRKLALRWLREFPENSHWANQVWTVLWRLYPDDGELRDIAVHWLQRANADHHSWYYVWLALHRENPADPRLSEIALAWLKQVRTTHHSWGDMWQTLWQLGESVALADLAQKWLDDTEVGPDNKSWPHVWRCVWDFRQTGKQQEMLRLALRELRHVDQQSAEWAVFWDMVFDRVKEEKEKEETLQAGLTWVSSQSPSEPHWPEFAKRLLKASVDSDQLLSLGLAGLDAADPEQMDWVRCWKNLCQVFPTSEEVLERGKGWLARQLGEHPGWFLVWEQLGADVVAGGLSDIAWRWLRQAHAAHEQWQYVWNKLRELEPENQELRELAITWLRKAPAEHLSWNFVWHPLFVEDPHNAELDRIARQWLADAPPYHEHWQYVWKELWSRASDDPQLVDLGLKWLEKAPAEHPSWQYVFRALLHLVITDEGQRQRMHRHGRIWLDEAGPLHHSWVRTFEDVWRIQPEDDLYEVGVVWLFETLQPKDASPHPEWDRLWERLWKHRPHDSRLHRLLINWLGAVNPAADEDRGLGAWSVLWKIAMSIDGLKEPATRLGFQWIRQLHATWLATDANETSNDE